MIMIDCDVKLLYNTSTGTQLPIKYARNGFSCLEDSLKTPWGRHEIVDFIGQDLHQDTVYSARKPIGLWDPNCSHEAITGRIIRLKGLEKGLNLGFDHLGRCVDTYERFVYIHGVPESLFMREDYGSKGCLILSNHNMVVLFDELMQAANRYAKIEVTIKSQ